MDKQAEQLLKSAQEVIKVQKTEIEKHVKAMGELKHFKLAFDIVAGMVAKEQVDPAEFQEKVTELSEKKAEELKRRGELLSIIDSDLDLGDLDERGKIAGADPAENGKSPTPHSQESMSAARTLIDNIMTN